MQKNHQLKITSVEQTIIDILKSKGQWYENETKINIRTFDIENCFIFLIQINRVSSTMMLSQNWPKEQFSLSKKTVMFAFLADQQTAGRGQKQNSWQSPQGNLYLTILVKLQFSYFPYLPIIAISKVFSTIKYFLNRAKCEKTFMIKWINDLMIDFEKVGGVLIKNQMYGQNLFTQIGIGINVKKSPLNLSPFANSTTNLFEQTGQNFSTEEICINLVQEFALLFFGENLNKVKSQSKKIYEENLAYLNRDVIIYDFKYEKVLGTGVFKGINEFGHAIIEGNEKPFVQGRMKAHHLAL